MDHQASVPSGQQTLTVMVQGQGQTSGQLQIIPQGVTVIPGPGQQLMQAALPSGQMQRFLFTPMASAATPTPSTGTTAFVGIKTVSLKVLTASLFSVNQTVPLFVCLFFQSLQPPPFRARPTPPPSRVQPCPPSRP